MKRKINYTEITVFISTIIALPVIIFWIYLSFNDASTSAWGFFILFSMLIVGVLVVIATIREFFKKDEKKNDTVK